ncbi:OLC1v1012282C1 [Oldenlandia corymbosa var. corymbosa]|uniref:OLC1v1012282C1 n=1 Tax=Oldenlandia corymbosa var. corymbosa TaxID=529605 RepID=A0AAV1DYY7_OLDCO|nr:OLC1v1012282C1 [Oldenlandia corymbosa var. corymbosa]
MDSSLSGENSQKMAFPKTVAPIVASAGGVAMFLVIASLLLISHPIGSTVSSYFYGVDRTVKVDHFATSNNRTSSKPSQTNVSGISNGNSSGLVLEIGTKQSSNGGKNADTAGNKTATLDVFDGANVQKSNRTADNLATSGKMDL